MPTKRILSRRANSQNISRPDQPLEGGPDMAFAMFKRWLEANETLYWTALRADNEERGQEVAE